ncbi:hypothetical protein WS97_00600 [Burkholderia territorii]|uniref:hypothetical protein n=1 Tax=Burkholderia territorii TaxID=1503055 RepID=UPI00075358AB|nr:hypothetical protein [Burkholderia territorii]KVL25452.1 hypothetical protein WS97_00600 [Burkholderia territorii]
MNNAESNVAIRIRADDLRTTAKEKTAHIANIFAAIESLVDTAAHPDTIVGLARCGRWLIEIVDDDVDYGVDEIVTGAQAAGNT